MYKSAFSTLWHRCFIGFRVTCPCTEELWEREYTSLVQNIINILGNVVGEDIHLRQFGVWILLVGMFQTPVMLSCLLGNIVPGVDFIPIEILIEIERSSREIEHLGFLFLQKVLDDAFAQ